MGESRHPLGPHLGRALFTYAQGSEYANAFKNVVQSGALVIIAAKMVGVSNVTTGWLVGIAAVGYLGLIFTIGWYHVQWGGAKEQVYRANLQDPWKVETLDLLRNIHMIVMERNEDLEAMIEMPHGSHPL